MIKFIRSILPAANRVVLGGTALVDLLGLTYVLLQDISTADQLTVVGVLTLITAKSGLFVKGWQQFEKALYQDELIRREHAAVTEQRAQAQQVGQRGSKPAGPILPR